MDIINVKNLCKTYKVSKRDSGFKNALKSFFKREYKYIKAVQDVSFTIREGEIVGYIGPNGAGKSTTIKMLSGILKPDSGKMIINGMDPVNDRIKYVKEIGVVFGQKSQLWWDIPAIESFDLLRDIYKLSNDEYVKTRDELIKLLELEEIVKMPVRQLSLGQRMKCELVASLLHNPKILFLDEPTIGLDAISKVIVRDFIKKINKAVFPGIQGGPLEHIIAAKGICFEEAAKPEFKEYAEQIVKNAKAFSEEFKKAGWKIISGGTDNHMFVLDTYSSISQLF